MLIKFSPVKELGAKILRVDQDTGEIILDVRDQPCALAAWICSVPGHTLEEYRTNDTKQGKWLSVNEHGTLRLSE